MKNILSHQFCERHITHWAPYSVVVSWGRMHPWDLGEGCASEYYIGHLKERTMKLGKKKGVLR